MWFTRFRGACRTRGGWSAAEEGFRGAAPVGMGNSAVKPLGDVGTIQKHFVYKYIGSTPVISHCIATHTPGDSEVVVRWVQSAGHGCSNTLGGLRWSKRTCRVARHAWPLRSEVLPSCWPGGVSHCFLFPEHTDCSADTELGHPSISFVVSGWWCVASTVWKAGCLHRAAACMRNASPLYLSILLVALAVG